MKNKFLCLIFLCFFFQKGNAQIRSLGVQPMAGDISSEGEVSTDIVKFKKAFQVYQKLVDARGDMRLPQPPFVLLSREKGNIAFMDYEKPEVQLEEKAFDVCAEFGDAGLAFLLGHELTHYYEKHGWKNGFAQDYGDLDIGLRLQKISDKVANETEADYLGGYLAYSAGFGLFDKGPELIQKLYAAYHKDSLLNGYPSLSDRQTLLRRTTEKVRQLVDVFEMANLLAAIGEYEDAFEYYRYIGLRYQTKEMYNNMGVAKVLDGLCYLPPAQTLYRYPIQLDLNYSGSKGSGASTDVAFRFREALLYFNAAISLDPDYAPAYLNKACALALLHDSERARFYADVEARTAAAKSGKYPKTTVDADVLIGILEAQAGHIEKAKKLFEKAATTPYGALAAYNLTVVQEERPAAPPKEKSSLDDETIDHLTIGAIRQPSGRGSSPAFVEEKSIDLSSELAFHQNPSPAQNGRSKVLISKRKGAPFLLFHLTQPGYTGKTARNIGLGASRADIVKAYGDPPNTIETPIGQIMVYPKTLKMLFILKENTLERWINYSDK